MTAYFLFFLWFAFGAFFDVDRRFSTYRAEFFIVSFIISIFFVGLRYKIGSDWASYIVFYDNAKPIADLFGTHSGGLGEETLEPGFNILMSLAKGVGLNFYFFVFFISVFNFITLYYFIFKSQIKCAGIFLAIMMILTTFSEFDILRQSIAFHIVLPSLATYPLKKPWFIVAVVFAMLFHYSAIFFLLFLFFEKVNLSKGLVLAITVCYLISSFVTLPILSGSLILAQPLVSGSFSLILSKAGTLMQAFSSERQFSFTNILNLLFLVTLYMRVVETNLNENEKGFIKMFLFYILINIFFKEIKEIVDRFAYYFIVGIAFMFASIPQFYTWKKVRFLPFLVPALFVIMRLTLAFQNPAIVLGQTPYRNYLLRDSYDEFDIDRRYRLMLSAAAAKNI